MDAARLTRFLHERIPVTAAMALEVTDRGPTHLVLRAPIGPNRNPHDTVFGGTLSTLGLVSGWTLLHAALDDAGLDFKLVGQKSTSEFLAPGLADCVATASCDADALASFLADCRARGRGRITVDSRIASNDVEVARHTGVFVAVQP
ncbi:MAG TPA: YiiD C-terminal domain-containing protein [Nevskiaceae bacterium]|nr:YiiD C-terminal domain-containing protein [Nevskiaceae bacterium]